MMPERSRKNHLPSQRPKFFYIANIFCVKIWLYLFVWLSLEANAKLKQRRESVAIYSRRDYQNCCVSPSSEIQALVDQMLGADKFVLAAKYRLFDFDESSFERC